MNTDKNKVENILVCKKYNVEYENGKKYIIKFDENDMKYKKIYIDNSNLISRYNMRTHDREENNYTDTENITENESEKMNEQFSISSESNYEIDEKINEVENLDGNLSDTNKSSTESDDVIKKNKVTELIDSANSNKIKQFRTDVINIFPRELIPLKVDTNKISDMKMHIFNPEIIQKNDNNPGKSDSVEAEDVPEKQCLKESQKEEENNSEKNKLDEIKNVPGKQCSEESQKEDKTVKLADEQKTDNWNLGQNEMKTVR